MTIIMSLFGCVVFVISLFTVGFKSAFKRLMLIIATGFAIDVSLIVLATGVSLALTY